MLSTQVVGQHGHLNWAVPLRVAPAAICNRVAINVPKRILADLPSLVRRLRERLPDVDVQGADVADRPLDVDFRQSLPQPAHDRRQIREHSLGHVDRDAVADRRGGDAEGHGPIQVAVLADDVVQHLL